MASVRKQFRIKFIVSEEHRSKIDKVSVVFRRDQMQHLIDLHRRCIHLTETSPQRKQTQTQNPRVGLRSPHRAQTRINAQ